VTEPPLPSWARPKPSGPPAPGSALEQQFETFIGPRWATYRRKFTPFFDEPRFQPTWNWSAAIMSLFSLGPVWFIYRKLYLPAVFFWLLPTIAMGLLWSGDALTLQDLVRDTPTARDFKLIAAGVQLSVALFAGGTANYLLFRRARAAISLAEQRAPDRETFELILTRLGRVNPIGATVVLVLMLIGGLAVSGGAVR
jgi:hypothetical protein